SIARRAAASPPNEKGGLRWKEGLYRSLDFEALLRRARVGPEGVERAHEERVAAWCQACVGLRRVAAREVWLRLLVLLPLDERAAKAGGFAARSELEARRAIC